MGLFKGLTASIILFIPLNFFIPYFGALLSGFISGIISKGKIKGLTAGILGPVFLLFIIQVIFGISQDVLRPIAGAFVLTSLNNLLNNIITFFSVFSIIFSAFGGFLGGILTPRKKKMDKKDGD